MEVSFVEAKGKRNIITKQQQKRIRKMYTDIANEMTKESEKLKGKTNVSSVVRKQYLEEFSKELKDEVQRITHEIELDVNANMLAVSESVIDDNNVLLNRMGFVIQGYYYVPQEVVERIVSGKLYKGKWQLSKAIWSDNKKTLQDIDDVIAKGIAANKSIYDIAKDLERYVNPNARKDWDWSKVYPGVKKRIDYNAQRLARTMISHAYEESFVRVTKKNPFIESYRWLISNSDRVCPVCIGRATEDNYNLGAGIYPKNHLPLDHPNGMCTFASVVNKSYEQIANDLAAWAKGEGNTSLNKKIDMFVADLKK